MTERDEPEDNTKLATETLQQLSLKEYEAKIFVALCRLPTGTAKEISEVADVPRSRVYDAIRILEARGLVEVEHTSPKKFRAIPLPEAIEILQEQYDSRIRRLRKALNDIEDRDTAEEETVEDLWTISEKKVVDSRTNELIKNASSEVILIVGAEPLLNDDVVKSLRAVDGKVSLRVGVSADGAEDRLRNELAGARLFRSELDWLNDEKQPENKTTIGRLLLIDREKALVSSLETDTMNERAIFGEGEGNGLVMLAQGIVEREADIGEGEA